MAAATLVFTAVHAQPAREVANEIRGLPLTRFYPFEEIGNVSRSPRLNFDPFGRLVVIQDGAYIVLNDTLWIDSADRTASDASMLDLVKGDDGRWYYGALGGWGTAEYTAQGKLRTRSLVPDSRPKWTLTTNFSEILTTSKGFYAGGWNGIVYVDYASGAQRFVEAPELSRIFKIGDRVFVSCHHHLLQYIDPSDESLHGVSGTDFDGFAVDRVGALDEGRVLVSVADGRMFVFDGARATPWDVQLGHSMNNRVSAIHRLVDGGVAVAVNGRGLFLVSTTGEIQTALTSPEYQRITDLAAREPGVLWLATENGVEKVLYGSPVTLFGQRLGLPVSWPQVVEWNGRVIIASGGRLYEAARGTSGAASVFRPIPEQPVVDAWAIAANGGHLLVGNAKGLFTLNETGGFVPVGVTMDVARLVMPTPDLCYAIGMSEVAALRWTNDHWVECAPRVAGFGYPSVVHAAGSSAWIELGPNRAARVALHGDRLQSRLFETFPWQDARWVNVGVVGNTVVLSGPNGGRIFFDEKSETICQAPELERLLNTAPFWITRIQPDRNGTLWASHERGILTINGVRGGERIDTATFDIVTERSPHIQLMPDGDVWISSGHVLYHVDRRSGAGLRRAFNPELISIVDGRSNLELLHGPAAMSKAHDLPYTHNTLAFRFFAGSYASRRAPVYEFRLNDRGGNWNTLGTGSVLNFHELWEGSYQLDVRLTDTQGPIGTPVSFYFSILPPWYRTWYAYLLGAAGAILAIWSLGRWLIHRAHARNVVLEQVIEKRTEELRATMQKLAEEMRNAATLAERARLAGEIHDSLQQGLSGLILQLDATLKLPGLTSDVRSRLSVARNMVSFTRHEVQHAVWDLESPLLEGTDLDDALRKITALISPGTVRIDIAVAGSPVMLSSEAKHHLLRIAQEAITNAVRHAGATIVTLRLDYEPDAVTLAVSDDGHGFNPAEVLSNGIGHFGLRGLRARADKIGGDLQLLSSPGHGTTIRVVMPVAPGANLPFHATVAAN